MGNINSFDQGGDIKTMEHTASVRGRKEVDRTVLIRRDIEMTIGFDELHIKNLQRFFSADDASFPSSDPLIGKLTQQSPQAGAADFLVDKIELIANDLATTGTNCDALERLVLDKLMEQGASFPPETVAGSDYYPAGVFYFLVADSQRVPAIDAALAPYRGKILAGYFKYDQATGEMALQSWPANMDDAGGRFKYLPSTFDARIRQYVVDASLTGIPTNDTAGDRAIIDPSVVTKTWHFDAADVSTHSLTVDLPNDLARYGVRLTIGGKRYDAGTSAWVAMTDVSTDAPHFAAATDTTAPMIASGGSQILDVAEVNYGSGALTLTIDVAFVAAATANSLPVQELTIRVECYSMASSKLVWGGITWAQFNDLFSTIRVNRGKPEITGCALIAHINDVGVSFVHTIPRAVFRPDGTVDFSKEDWLKGKFVIRALKADNAFMPYVPVRTPLPFGYINTFLVRANNA